MWDQTGGTGGGNGRREASCQIRAKSNPLFRAMRGAVLTEVGSSSVHHTTRPFLRAALKHSNWIRVGRQSRFRMITPMISQFMDVQPFLLSLFAGDPTPVRLGTSTRSAPLSFLSSIGSMRSVAVCLPSVYDCVSVCVCVSVYVCV